MTRTATAASTRRTVADLLKALGGIPADRVRLDRTPGTATEQDVLDIEARENRLCELVDGVLVEKVMGFHESRLTLDLIVFLKLYLRQHNLGVIAGADGMLKLTTGLMRIPDVSFVSWDRLPGRKLPPEPIPLLPIDLAVEVISKGNTRGEMERKLREYFAAGTLLVWFIYPKTRTARVYTAPGRSTRLGEDGVLDGDAVLPGFALPLRELFAQANREADA
jgi:Uma2 family endonuclease